MSHILHDTCDLLCNKNLAMKSENLCSYVTYIKAGDWLKFAAIGNTKPGEIGISLVCLDVTITMIATNDVTNNVALNITSTITWFLVAPVPLLNL